MSEVEAVVQVIFFLISTIILQAGYIADVALLGVLYLLLPHCSNHPNRQSSRPSVFKGTKAAHAIFIFILSAIWLSAMGLKIQYQVGRVIGDPSGLYYHTLPNIHKLNGTYNILYFFGALEVLVWSILGFIDTKKRKASGQVRAYLKPNTSSAMLTESSCKSYYSVWSLARSSYAPYTSWPSRSTKIFNSTTAVGA